MATASKDKVKTLEFTEAPSFKGLYRKILFGKKPGFRPGDKIPRICAFWKGAKVDPERVQGYRKTCFIRDDGALPILYPHVLTSSTHMHITSQPEFPVKLLGAVHARNHVLQHRPLRIDETFDIVCDLRDWRVVKQGLEWDIMTVLHVDGQRVWESISTYLVRGKKFGTQGTASELSTLPDLAKYAGSEKWKVPDGIGREYAKITGDYNPIHLYNITAKLFGFPQALVHGMWSAARCLGNLPKLPKDDPIRADLIFKGPVYIPGECELRYVTEDYSHRFHLMYVGNNRPVIDGRMRKEDPGVNLV